MAWIRRIAFSIGVLALIGSIAYYWLIVESHLPSSGNYAIDMAELRRLADEMPGDKPLEIRVETVGTIHFPKTAVVAGDGWDQTDLPVSAYQLVYADKSVLIDTAYDEATAVKGQAPASNFDSQAFGRIVAAMNSASLILITHEHWDHSAGLFSQPNLEKLLSVTKLNQEQVDNADRMAPLTFPAELKSKYQAITYDHYLAIAPGVVLIRAAGHTPGSQIVYVKRADGAEYLFLGDVAWHKRNIDLVRERARLVTWWFLKEDRDAVMLQLAALNRLQHEEPNLFIMPGHDPKILASAIGQGMLTTGFK